MLRRHVLGRPSVAGENWFRTFVRPGIPWRLWTCGYRWSNRYDQAGREAEAERKRHSPTEPPLLRGRLLRLADEEHHLLLTVHHLAFDGSSFGPFINELCAIYALGSKMGTASPPSCSMRILPLAAPAFDSTALAPLIHYWKQCWAVRFLFSPSAVRLAADPSPDLSRCLYSIGDF
jgi:hypothetical protein